jgi:hypothetical protein
MANQQVINPPTTAYCLALIGGILGLILGVILTLIIVGIWFLVVNALVIVYARKLMAEPMAHSKYGTYLLVLSILGGINIFVLIGAIVAMSYRPLSTQPYAQQPYQPYQPYAQQQPAQTPPTQYAGSKYCPQCGNAVGAEAAYCPKCGTKLPT